jgi:hypothetical protein
MGRRVPDKYLGYKNATSTIVMYYPSTMHSSLFHSFSEGELSPICSNAWSWLDYSEVAQGSERLRNVYYVLSEANCWKVFFTASEKETSCRWGSTKSPTPWTKNIHHPQHIWHSSIIEQYIVMEFTNTCMLYSLITSCPSPASEKQERRGLRLHI